MPKRKSNICYLCGKAGADSKDHVPPKGLLPTGQSFDNRITVPAHRDCNSNASLDEEYLRDLIIPEAIQHGFQDADEPYKKTWRAWSKPAGWERYKKFMANSQPVELRTSSGLYAGRAIGIVPEKDKIISVGKKIARGIIFYDTQAYMDANEIIIALLSATEVISLREKDSSQKYWRAMHHPTCKHSIFANGIALRRFYQGHSSSDKKFFIEGHLGIILWHLFFAVSFLIPIEKIKKKNFQFVIETTNGTWQHNTEAD